MSIEEFKARAMQLMPSAKFIVDNDGQVVIYTNIKLEDFTLDEEDE